MAQIKTAISIREDLLKEANTVAKEVNLTRSGLFEKALEQFLERYRNTRLIREINAAYTTPLTEDETGSLEIIRSHARRPTSEDEW
jgi:metal-responsive CopG/Arc/MetJ family transcriptional regulator